MLDYISFGSCFPNIVYTHFLKSLRSLCRTPFYREVYRKGRVLLQHNLHMLLSQHGCHCAMLQMCRETRASWAGMEVSAGSGAADLMPAGTGRFMQGSMESGEGGRRAVWGGAFLLGRAEHQEDWSQEGSAETSSAVS